MIENLFKEVSIGKGLLKWENCTSRIDGLYHRDVDIRTEFYRDYSRILHCQPYRRLKHKTQVFFATHNDHICTRMEHVNHVVSVSYTIANFLGLNTELTSAIALGHDIGHAPFGHEGEERLKEIAKQIGLKFWHEKNGLYVCDNIATLADTNSNQQNLNLTYAVRDGIISHCGEINENAITPRDEHIDLSVIQKASEFQPYTWEACVVKISDKIAYLGRDIEDAIELKLLTKTQIRELKNLVYKIVGLETLNNGILIHDLSLDLCRNSSPEKGLVLSPQYLDLINSIKAFNYRHIYKHTRLEHYTKYSGVIIATLNEFLCSLYSGKGTVDILDKQISLFPTLAVSFRDWLIKYGNVDKKRKRTLRANNKVIYNLDSENDYKRAIIDFIAGMTDNFAIKLYNEIISF